MAFHTDSRIGELVARLRTASPTDNPFTTATAEALVPSAEERAAAGEASVGMLHGLAGLTEAAFTAASDGRVAARDVSGVLRGFADAIERAAYQDNRATFL